MAVLTNQDELRSNDKGVFCSALRSPELIFNPVDVESATLYRRLLLAVTQNTLPVSLRLPQIKDLLCSSGMNEMSTLPSAVR
jgi:hypothetical protein